MYEDEILRIPRNEKELWEIPGAINCRFMALVSELHMLEWEAIPSAIVVC